jgi:hypothetical protein
MEFWFGAVTGALFVFVFEVILLIIAYIVQVVKDPK